MPEIQMPKLSDTMTEGTLVAWKKKKGDKVSAGDVIAEIETDKATMEWESQEDGTLTEIYVEEGGKVEVGQRIAFIGEPSEGGEKEAPKKSEEPKKKPAETEKPAPAEAKEKETAPPQDKKVSEKKPGAAGVSPARKQEEKTESEQPTRLPAKKSEEETRVRASPVARRIAVELGVDLAAVQGSGPDGRVTETDVRVAAKPAGPSRTGISDRSPSPTRKSAAPKPGVGSRLQLSGMRTGIAERLVQSKAPVPHFYLNIEIDAGALMRVRGELKAAGEEEDASKITANDFILRATVLAALREPKVNASFDGDAIVQYGDINLGVAVALDEGLVTPVIRGAQNKSLREISAAVKDLAHRARNKRMKPEEFQGGTLTVSNLGSYGIDYFSAVINPPQAIILSIGAIVSQPVVGEKGAISAGYRMKIGMSCDHRVVDGAIGANYLKALRHLLESPSLLLI